MGTSPCDVLGVGGPGGGEAFTFGNVQIPPILRERHTKTISQTVFGAMDSVQVVICLHGKGKSKKNNNNWNLENASSVTCVL